MQSRRAATPVASISAYAALLVALGCSASVQSPPDLSQVTLRGQPASVASVSEAAQAPSDTRVDAIAPEPVALREPARREQVPYLSPGHVAAAVRAHHSEFVACHALADLESRRGAGSVTVGWLVDVDGSVVRARVGRTSFASPRVNQCVLDVAEGMTFPPSPMRTEVSWTVHFQGSPSGRVAEATPSLP